MRHTLCQKLLKSANKIVFLGDHLRLRPFCAGVLEVNKVTATTCRFCQWASDVRGQNSKWWGMFLHLDLILRIKRSFVQLRLRAKSGYLHCNAMSVGINICLNAASHQSLHGRGHNLFKAWVQEYSRVDLGHRQLWLYNYNHWPFSATDDNTFRTSLVVTRLQILGSEGPWGWTRELFSSRSISSHILKLIQKWVCRGQSPIR